MWSSGRILCLPVLMLVALNVFAQQITANIRGTVVDVSGAVLQGASVTAKQMETGFTRTATTDRTGEYVLLELPIGHYELTAEDKGFQKYLQQGISLDVNETATITVHLAVGAETQQVAVTADAQMIQDTVTSLGKVVLEREMRGSSSRWPQFFSARNAAARRCPADPWIEGSGIVPCAKDSPTQ